MSKQDMSRRNFLSGSAVGTAVGAAALWDPGLPRRRRSASSATTCSICRSRK